MTNNNLNLPKENIPKVEEIRYLDVEENSRLTNFVELVFPKVHCMSGSSNFPARSFNPPARITSQPSGGSSSSGSSGVGTHGGVNTLSSANRQRAAAREGRQITPEPSASGRGCNIL